MYVLGAAHALVDVGQVAIARPVGLAIALTTVPSWVSSEFGAPQLFFDLGRIALGTADGWLPSIPLVTTAQLVLPVASDMTLLGWTLSDGVAATVTELLDRTVVDNATITTPTDGSEAIASLHTVSGDWRSETITVGPISPGAPGVTVQAYATAAGASFDAAHQVGRVDVVGTALKTLTVGAASLPGLQLTWTVKRRTGAGAAITVPVVVERRLAL